MNGRRTATIVDVVTARALHYGLRSSAAPANAPALLAELARHERAVLVRALRRVNRARLDRPSEVATQAIDALQQALLLCPPPHVVDVRTEG